MQLLSNPLLIILLLIGIGIPVSLAARFFELKGLQVWLPFSIIVAIGTGPIEGFIVAAVIMFVSFIVKPYPPATLGVMLAFLLITLFSLQFFPIGQNNFVFYAMLATLIYLSAVNITLAFIYPDVKTALLFFAFGIPMSFVLYYQIGWTVVKILKGAAIF